MSRKETACGKAPKRGDGPGVAYMKNPDMKAFIIMYGTDAARQALDDVTGTASRSKLCEIFHMFRRGREEIAKSGAPAGFRLTPSPNRVRAASPEKKQVSPKSIPIRARGRVVSGMSRARSASSSPNYSPGMLAKIFAFTKGTERRRLLKAGLKGLSLKKPGVVKRVGGVQVRMMLPRKEPMSRATTRFEPSSRVLAGYWEHANEVPVNLIGNNFGRNSGSESGSNRSQLSNYASENEGRNNRAYKYKEPKEVKVKARLFSTKEVIRPVTGMKRASPKPVKRSRVIKFLELPKITSNKTRRVPTQSRVVAYGSKSRLTHAQLKAANNMRWKKYEEMNKSKLNTNERAALANRLLQNALKNIKNKKVSPVKIQAAVRASIRNNMKNLFGSNSNSSSSPGPVVKSTVKRVRERLERRLRAMSRRKLPKAPLAEEFERSMLKGPQGEKVSMRKTAEERARLKEIEDKLVKFKNNSSSGNSSSSGSPVVRKASASASGVKSLRRKK